MPNMEDEGSQQSSQPSKCGELGQMEDDSSYADAHDETHSVDDAHGQRTQQSVPSEFVPSMPELVLSSPLGTGLDFAGGDDVATIRAGAHRKSRRRSRWRPQHDMSLENGANDIDSSDSDTNVADEKQEVSGILEHLIVQGNYYRHLQWRIDQWNRQQEEQSVDTQKNDNPGMVGISESISLLDSDTSASEEDGISRNDQAADTGSESSYGESISKKRKRKPTINRNHTTTRPVAKAVTRMLHASDSRIYHHRGLEPDVWPKLPSLAGKESAVTDAAWEDELSDPLVHPITFCKLRRSATLDLEGTAPENDENQQNSSQYLDENDIDNGSSRQCDVDADDPIRVMLLHCWDRAVHAASTTITVEPTTEFLSASSTTRSVMFTQQGDIPSGGQDPSLTDAIQSNAEALQCGDRLPFKSHHSTTATTVLQRRQHKKQSLQILQRILEKEVQLQIQQLVQVVVSDAEAVLVQKKEMSGNRNRSSPQLPQSHHSPVLLDAFDMIRIWENRLGRRRAVGGPMTNVATFSDTGSFRVNNGAQAGIETDQETLEILENDPPLLINTSILDALRTRVIDRYANVPW